MISKLDIVKDKKFQQWVCDTKPCYMCTVVNGFQNFSQIQFHHLQGKYRLGAMIRQDSKGIPLCFPCHNLFTKRGERLVWEEIGVDPGIYADELWDEWQERKK